jgi:ribosomal protein S18 acetylase RimI-like enzyme
VFGIGFGVTQNATITLMYSRVPASGYGTVSALWNFAYDAGMGVGAVGFGAVAGLTGYPWAFALTAALMLTALAPAWYDRAARPRRGAYAPLPSPRSRKPDPSAVPEWLVNDPLSSTVLRGGEELMKKKGAESEPSAELRQARVSDHPTIVACVQQWWGDTRTADQARELSLLLPRLFLQFFSGTSLVLEDEMGIRAFLVGFYAADNGDDAYIHFVGVDPALRGQSVARRLYTTFFRSAAESGRSEVRAITSPSNTGSIAFHRAMGFEVEEGDRDVDGLFVHSDYDGPGQDRVCFRRRIAP